MLYHSLFLFSSGCKDSIARVVREAIEDKSRDGVRYLELRFSPHLLANCDVTPMLNCKEKYVIKYFYRHCQIVALQ